MKTTHHIARAVSSVPLCGWRARSAEDPLITGHEAGRCGGRPVVSQHAGPKTSNPVTALDAPSREVIRRMHADLVSVDRETQQSVPSLAKRWQASPVGDFRPAVLAHHTLWNDEELYLRGAEVAS